VETDISSRRVSCTHTTSGRFSRSEIHSCGDRVYCGSITSVGFVGLTLCLAFLAIWGSRVTVGFVTDFVVFPFCLLLTTFAYSGVFVTSSSVIRFECGSDLEYRRLLDDVVPKVDHALLFCKRSRPFSFNPRRSTDNTTSLVALRHLLYMSRLRFFPLCGCHRRSAFFVL
jgi:hypothetical protein